MSEPLDEKTELAQANLEPLSVLMMKCAVSPDDQELQRETSIVLEAVLSAWALARCPTSFHILGADHPGMVSAVVSDRSVNIPCHVIELFPSESELNDLVVLAENVRVMTDSTICLSGSRVFGIESAVDTDYCEYVLHTGRRLAGSFLKLDAARSSECRKVKHGGNELAGEESIIAGVDELCRTDTGVVGGVCVCNPRHWKFDYLLPGPTEQRVATNLCIHEEDCRADSWAYQEASITTAGQPLPGLSSPGHLGDYIIWLRQQVDEVRPTSTLKALKKALALTRLIFLNQTADVIVRHLNSTGAVALASLEVRRELRKLKLKKSNLEDEPPVGTRDSSSEQVELDCDPHVERFLTQANDLLDNVLCQYDELYNRVVDQDT